MTAYGLARRKQREKRANLGQKNYRAGYLFELEVFQYEQSVSIHVSHRADSRTPFDLVATKAKHIDYINCKRNGYLPPAERQALIELAARIPAFGRVWVVSENPSDRSELQYERIK